MERRTFEHLFFCFGNLFRKRSTTTTVIPIAAVIQRASTVRVTNAFLVELGIGKRTACILSTASSLISLKPDKEEAGGKLSRVSSAASS